MARYPQPVNDREWFTTELADLRARVREAETRTLHGTQVRTGTVDPSYSSGKPKVTFEGDAALSGPYQYVGTPSAGGAVLLISKGATWIVMAPLQG